MAIESYGESPAKVSTTTKLCFLSECVTNASGLQFSDGSVSYIYADDARGIHLNIPSIVINEVRVEAAQEPLEID